MRPNKHSYTIQTSVQFQHGISTPVSQINKYKRLFSLQKIRINSKGLPDDFFSPLLPKKEPSKKSIKHANINKFEGEKVKLRITPHFQDQSIMQGYQPRQYKSEERKHGTNAKDMPFSQRQIKIEKQYTFSQSFFDQEDQRLQRTNNKYHNGNKHIKKAVWQQQRGMSILQKKQLGELASRKYMVNQKYINCFQNRVIPSKPKSTLPLLKARFPSVFGT